MATSCFMAIIMWDSYPESGIRLFPDYCNTFVLSSCIHLIIYKITKAKRSPQLVCGAYTNYSPLI